MITNEQMAKLEAEEAAKAKQNQPPPAPPSEPSIFQKFLDAYRNAGPMQRIGAAAGGLGAAALGPPGWLAGTLLAAGGAGAGGLLGELYDRYASKGPLNDAMRKGLAESTGITPGTKPGAPIDWHGPAADALSTLGLSALAKGGGELATRFFSAPRLGGVLAARTPQEMAYEAAPAAVKAPGFGTPELQALDAEGAKGLPGMQRMAATEAGIAQQAGENWRIAEAANKARAGALRRLSSSVEPQAQAATNLKGEVRRALGENPVEVSAEKYAKVDKTVTPPDGPPMERPTVETVTSTAGSSDPTASELSGAMNDPASVWGTADDPAVLRTKQIQDRIAAKAAMNKQILDEASRREAEARVLEAYNEGNNAFQREAGYTALAPKESTAHVRTGGLPIGGAMGEEARAYIPVHGLGMSPDKAGQSVASTLMARGAGTVNPDMQKLLAGGNTYKLAPVPQGLDEILREFLASTQQKQSTPQGAAQ